MEQNEIKYELIFCIVNKGFSDLVVSEAREVGVSGGTIINARGSAGQDIESRFNISISPEKEIVLMVVKKEIKDAVLNVIYKKAGLGTPGNGIAFSCPVDETVGLKKLTEVKEETKE